MAEPTAKQNRYMHDLVGVNPDAFASATTPSMVPLDPSFMANLDEAKKWVTKYLDGNGVAAVPGADTSGAKAQVMFDGKATPLDTVVNTTLAASRLAKLKNEATHNQIDDRMIRGVIRQMLTPAPAPAADDGDAKAPEKKKDDDSDVETTIEVTPQGVQTNIQFTIKLRAVGDDDPRRVVLLPDIEVTLHVGKDASASTVEAQLNLIKIKQDVSKRLTFNGHILVQSIEFKTGVSAEANMTDVALARIQKSVEVKVKAELEFKVSKAFSFSAEADAGQGGFSVGPKLIFHF